MGRRPKTPRVGRRAATRRRIGIRGAPDRIEVPDIGLTPEVRDRIADFLKRRAVPLALLPLALEYRFMKVNVPVKIKDTGDIREAIKPFEAARGLKSLAKRQEAAAKKAATLDRFAKRSAKFETRKFEQAEQLWVRWYPDEGFAEEGIAPMSEDEAAAKRAFEEAIGGRPWWDMSDAEVSAQWQHFVSGVGACRAVHLMRAGDAAGDADYQARIGRIAALPGKVALYGVIEGTVEYLAEGGKIPANTKAAASVVSYTPEAADPGGWLVDFETAVNHGMGVRIDDPETIKRARAADWIIAVGLAGSGARDEIEALLRSHVATGAFGVIPQDSATNNSPDGLSYLNRPEADLAGFTPRATALEGGGYGSGKTHAADLLAEAFDLPQAELRKAVDGDDTGFEDARAMLRVIGPALLDSALDGVSQVPGVTEDAFIEIMAASIAARGALPAIRVGRNAMGVLPMTEIGAFKPDAPGQDDATKKVHDFLTRYSQFNRAFLPPQADASVPVIKPGDPESADTLFDILSTTRVSKRIDVSGVGANADDIKGLGCPYVDGGQAKYRASSYLVALRETPLADLPDPDLRNRRWPLLYRLARLTLERNIKSWVLKDVFETSDSGSGPGGGRPHILDLELNTVTDLKLRRQLQVIDKTMSGFSAGSAGRLGPGGIGLEAIDSRVIEKVSRLNQDFAAALRQLESIARRPQGRAHLEVLLCEVIDLFQHRVDAFATGLAYARLKADRQAGQTGLAGGYYGFIGKLRPESATGGSDGYIQAPSVPQAQTAALLRSAYLRHRGGGAFSIDLGSGRTRRALRLMDLIGKGHDLQEGLGLRGERWLHDMKHDALILQLRARYPLEGEREDGITARRVFNGLAFVDDPQTQGPLKALQAVLADDLDALADIVMAEAVHRRALGQGDAANAWLQVLSGHPPPGQPLFLKTQRLGQGSSYRVSLMLDEVAPEPKARPREIAEPGLAGFAAQVFDGFGEARLEMSLSAPASTAGGPGPTSTVSLRLAEDLGMAPIDLVIGGASEVQVRAKAAIARQLMQQPALLAQLGDVQPGDGLAFDVNLSAGQPSLEELLQRAELIRKTAKNGRSLDHADLNASADIRNGELPEAEAIMAVAYGISALRERIKLLHARMKAVLDAANNAISVFETEVLEALRVIDSGVGQPEIDRAMERVEQHRAVLLGRFLEPLADYGMPGALRHFTSAEAVEDPEAVIGRLRDMTARMETQKARLAAALRDPAATGHASLADAKGDLQGCVAALQQALDGEAMIILPPVPRNLPALQPVVDAAAGVSEALDPWGARRPNTGRAAQLASLAGRSGFRSRREATIDPDDLQADPRPVEEAPQVRHHGMFLSGDTLMERKMPVCGIVCDEWSLQRPSQTQPAGIAINYDSPQSEAPHAILLGVAPHDGVRNWTGLRAARLVFETINWMKIRALSSHERAFPGAALPGANVIAHKTDGDQDRARIPQFRLRNTGLALGTGGLAFRLVDGLDDLLRLGTSANALAVAERRGFGVVKE
ncbi:hypothetical protein SAMN04488077_10328 [Roseovarius tolerans]|uniref:Uncharacterized protein n=1 Tax=Roseovarius tolerans TaxID=74031 RepID=A0A1H7WK60_9RHOB|nr:hypothetical protein [Roseovarius tolerans]SEM21515.1 hypothetical protein SAMN04488077_10328 [Roseovarius tolerans]